MSEDWDVDSYKSDHENEEHWDLRRKFMLAHKDKFSEDEVVCLAQVFTNIEFMGCRYPDQTMARVAELAKGVVEKFREQRKNSLKRTFVAASDAASSKVKGQSAKGVDKGPEAKKIKMNFVPAEDDDDKSGNDVEVITLDDKAKSKLENNQSDVRISKYGGVKTFNINSNKQYGGQSNTSQGNGPLGDFVLIFGSGDENSTTVVQKSAAMNKCTIRWDFEEGVGSLKVCKLYINDRFIATGVGENMKQSKENTAITALAKLRESYYGIKVKTSFFSDTTVNSSQLKSGNDSTKQEKLSEDNIGRKLMKLMGWQGGGLGSNEQGIEEPIAAGRVQVRRDGFGSDKSNADLMEFKKKAREYIRNWLNGDSDQDLVFSSEFSSDERKIMHELAFSFSLKSKSYGKDANRQLVISRKSLPWEIVQELKTTGGTSDKYELLHPTKPYS